MVDIEHIRQRSWDFALTVITVVILASLGVQSFVGTIWVLFAEKTIAGWEQAAGYTSYVSTMNAIAAPQILALVVVMGLCVPKRLFSRRLLIWVSLAMVAVGVAAGLATKSLGRGLAVYLGLAAVIQVAVVVMTVAGVRGPSYLTEGRLTKTGSGLLHLGFIVFGIVIVALQNSSLMLPVFSASAVLVTVGTAMAFYADRLAWRRPHTELLGFSEAEEALAEAGEDVEDLEMPEAWP
jgi:hypothetical protein